MGTVPSLPEGTLSDNPPVVPGIETEQALFVFDEDTDPVVAALPYVETEILARIAPGADPGDLSDLYDQLGLTLIEEFPEIETATLSVASVGLTQAAHDLDADPNVESVHKNYEYEVQERPNDPDFSSQRHLAAIGVPDAWEITTGSESGIIAVVDTGVEVDHPDLESKLVPGWNIYDDDNDSDDVLGHGTAVAGTAAALSNNRRGVSGVCWDNPIMPVRIASPRGSASSRRVAAGIIWAVDHGAKVINVSFAPLASDSTVLRAAEYARNSGSLVVISSGNDGERLRARSTEAAVFVGAVDDAGGLASFSNTGPFVDLVAPGRDVLTTKIGRDYGEISGTSFSSPIVAGVAALVWSVNPEFRPTTVQSILLDTARDRGQRGRDESYGAGVVDALAAVTAAVDIVEERDTRSPTVHFSDPEDMDTVSGTIVVSGAVFDAVGVADVILSVDGLPFATDTSAPYRFVINTRKLDPGVHTLSLVGTDFSGNSSRPTSVRVVVEGSTGGNGGSSSGGRDRVEPVIVINFPVDGSRVSRSVGVQVTLTDNDELYRVEWSVDGGSAGSENLGGFREVVSFVWNGQTATRGPHVLTIRVEDSAGNYSTANLTLIKE